MQAPRIKTEFAIMAIVGFMLITFALGVSWTGGELEDFPAICGDGNYAYGLTATKLLCRPDTNNGGTTGSTQDLNKYWDKAKGDENANLLIKTQMDSNLTNYEKKADLNADINAQLGKQSCPVGQALQTLGNSITCIEVGTSSSTDSTLDSNQQAREHFQTLDQNYSGVFDVNKIFKADGNSFYGDNNSSIIHINAVDGVAGSIPALPTSGLVNDWNMNEGSSTTLTDTVSSDNMTLNKASWSTGGGIIGEDVVDCDGSTSAKTGSALTPTSTFTITGWFKFATPAGTGEIFTISNNQFQLQADPSGVLRPCNSSNCGSWGSYLDNAWHFIGIVGDGASTISYIDGSLSAGGDIGVSSIDNNMLMCYNDYYAGYYGTGLVEKWKVYSSALSASTIQDIYYYDKQTGAGAVPASPAKNIHLINKAFNPNDTNDQQVDGNTETDNILVKLAYYDSLMSKGNNGEILSSTGTATKWIASTSAPTAYYCDSTVNLPVCDSWAWTYTCSSYGSGYYCDDASCSCAGMGTCPAFEPCTSWGYNSVCASTTNYDVCTGWTLH